MKVRAVTVWFLALTMTNGCIWYGFNDSWAAFACGVCINIFAYELISDICRAKGGTG